MSSLVALHDVAGANLNALDDSNGGGTVQNFVEENDGGGEPSWTKIFGDKHRAFRMKRTVSNPDIQRTGDMDAPDPALSFSA